jgi:group I intron endonuclease
MIIYKIENKINGKIYIGKTHRVLSSRIRAHVYENKSYVQRALNKFGLQSFEISVIDKADTAEILNEKEKHWIKIFGSKFPYGYNLTDGGDGLVNPSEETRRKMRTMLGKTHTEPTKQKMSASGGNRRGVKTSEATKQKQRERRLQYFGVAGNREKTAIATKNGMANPEVKHKLSVTGKGRVPWNKGMELSDDIKSKLSASHKGHIPWNKGLRRRSNLRRTGGLK